MTTQRDRDGDLIERPDDGEPQAHYCVDGWKGEDAQGRPVLCPICRPDTVARIRRQRLRTEPDHNPLWRSA